MENKIGIGVGFAVLTVLAVYYFWHDPESQFGLWAAVVVAVVMAALLFVLRGKRFAGPPIGDEIAKRRAEIAAAEAAVGERA
jgi:hypothetical protein